MVRRFWARLFDHRVWIVGIGFLAFASSIILFMVLPQQFQPTINSDYSQVKYELPPGSTLEQSEEIVRQIGAILDNSPVVETAFYRSEEHTSELQSLMRISYAVFCLKKNINIEPMTTTHDTT